MMSTSSTARQLDPAEPFLTATAQFRTQWLQPATAVIAVCGELDGANARAFINYVLVRIPYCDQLILDLSSVDFFGTAPFSAVHTVGVRAVGEGVDWTLVPSREVTRFTRYL